MNPPYKFVICFKLSILSFSVQKKSPSDCFSLYGHFLKINPSSKGFIFVADRFVLLKGFAMMVAETVTHFSQEGGFMDTKFQDVGAFISKLLQLILVMNLITEDVSIETLFSWPLFEEGTWFNCWFYFYVILLTSLFPALMSTCFNQLWFSRWAVHLITLKMGIGDLNLLRYNKLGKLVK